jgi:hypothetical protein
MFEDVDTEIPGSPPPEESDNRTFLIAAGILGGITLISLICMAAYAIFWVPIQRANRATQEAAIALQKSQATATAIQGKTQTAEARQPTATSSPTVTNTPTSSATPVIAQATDTPDVTNTPGPRTATVAALLTQAAQQTQTVLPTSTELPDTGFADDVGIPTMLALAVVFVAVIFLVRRMRAVTG